MGFPEDFSTSRVCGVGFMVCPLGTFPQTGECGVWFVVPWRLFHTPGAVGCDLWFHGEFSTHQGVGMWFVVPWGVFHTPGGVECGLWFPGEFSKHQGVQNVVCGSLGPRCYTVPLNVLWNRVAEAYAIDSRTPASIRQYRQVCQSPSPTFPENLIGGMWRDVECGMWK